MTGDPAVLCYFVNRCDKHSCHSAAARGAAQRRGLPGTGLQGRQVRDRPCFVVIWYGVMLHAVIFPHCVGLSWCC
jgi:hypothetical protein